MDSKCVACGLQMVYDSVEGELICSCGNTCFAQPYDTKTPLDAYTDKPQEQKTRRNVLKILHQAQGKETEVIPDEVYRKIDEEFKRLDIVKSYRIPLKIYKMVLKHPDLVEYKDSAVYIRKTHLELVTPLMTPPMEDKLVEFFLKTATLWPKGKDSYMPKSFVFYMLIRDEIEKHHDEFKPFENLFTLGRNNKTNAKINRQWNKVKKDVYS